MREWGPFTEKAVQFAPGKNVICGRNFSGKSSLVNAIFYALTGEVLPAKARPADFARRRSKDSMVELDIRLGTNTYRIRRHPTKNQSYMLVLKDDSEVSQVAAGPTVEERVAELLGVQMPELTQAIFMKEGEVAEYLASTTPARRREFVKSLVKMDRLEEVAEAAAEWQKQLGAEARELDKAMASERQRVADLSTMPLVGEKASLERDIALLESEKQELVEEKASLKEIAENVRKLEENEARAEKMVADKNSLLARLNSELSPFGSVDEIASQLESIAISANDLALKQGMEREALNKEAMMRALRGSIKDALDSVQRLKEKGAAECPTCHQKVTPEILDRILADKRRELEAIDKELQSAAEAASHATKERQAVQEALQKKEALRRKMATIEDLTSRFKTLEEESARLQREIDDLKSKVEGAERIAEIDSKIAKLDEVLGEKRERRDRVVSAESALKEAQNRLGEFEERARELSRKRALAKVLKSACEETIVELGSIPIRKIQQLAGAAIGRLGILDGWQVDLEENMLLPVARRGEENVSASAMSASEKMLCFLAIRFAIAQAIAGSDFMVLDEPTEHLDQERVERMRQFLRDVPAPEQIIVTSNEEALLEGAWANEIRL